MTTINNSTIIQGLIRESKSVNLNIKSKPWTEEELKALREIMASQKQRQGLPSKATKKKRGKKQKA